MAFLPLTKRLDLAAQPVTVPQSITAPVTGWNTRDSLDAMPPTDAVTLDNWFPGTNGCTLRNGSQIWATGASTSPVQTLAEYLSGSSNKLFAAASSHIFDVTSTGVAVSVVSGLTFPIWSTVNFKSRLFWVNGHDTPQVYDGTSFADPGWTGVSGGESTLTGLFVYQQQIYAWQGGSQGFWYLGLNNVTGAMTFFDLSTLTSRGGKIIGMSSISYDGGNGVLDYICFIMSSGDVHIYQGNDPGNSSTWSLVGTYHFAPPVNQRSICVYGGETYYTTFDDHIPFQQAFAALRNGQVPPRSKISPSVAEAVTANFNGFGWQALYYPKGRYLLFNIPNPDGTFYQHIFNTVQNAWCRFKGMDAQCWALFGNNLYFGGLNGTVYQADTTNNDNGQPIIGDGQQAWNMLQNPQRKRITATRPIIQSFGPITYNFGVNWDYSPIPVTIAAATNSGGSPWNTSPWNTSPWSAESQINVAWRISGGTGQSIGWRLQVAGLQPITWLRTDLRSETGNAL